MLKKILKWGVRAGLSITYGVVAFIYAEALGVSLAWQESAELVTLLIVTIILSVIGAVLSWRA